jgi:hypothetical protein
MVTKNHPNEIQTHLCIAVDKAVAHPGDFPPGDFRMGGLRGGRDLARRLAENLQRSNGCILVQPTRKESALIESFDKGLCIARREQHIEKQCRVSLRQISHRPFRLLSGSPGGE